MDYKYIEQLIERYFKCETTVEEEHILREFYAQSEVPAHLQKWQPLFKAQHDLSATRLSDDFDQRILAMTEQAAASEPVEKHVQARTITMAQRLVPLYKAAAIVAFAIVIGTAVEHATESQDDIYSEQIASGSQDELDEDETTTIDIKSAEAAGDLIDSVLTPNATPPTTPISQP